MIRVRLSELELAGFGDEIWDELAPRAEKATGEGAGMIVAAARVNLSRRQGTKRTAAPAGEPPEYDLGALHDSVKVGKARRTKYGVRQEYGSDHVAAGLHEFGGTVKQDGEIHRYPPRSYLRTAEEETRAEVERRLEEV